MKIKPLFELGRVCLTPGVAEIVEHTSENLLTLIVRHCSGDFGTICEDDKQANLDAIKYGERILSAYIFGGRKIWIISEADRSATTVLLPSEY